MNMKVNYHDTSSNGASGLDLFLLLGMYLFLLLAMYLWFILLWRKNDIQFILLPGWGGEINTWEKLKEKKGTV